MYSIWQDINVTLTSYLSSGKVTYSVKEGNTAIYTGTAYAAADGKCVINLHDLLKDFLGRSDEETELSDEEMVGTFSVVVNGTTVWSNMVLNCWDYKTVISYTSDDEVLTTLIKGDWVAAGPVPKTMWVAPTSEGEEGYVLQSSNDKSGNYFTLDELKCRKRTDICDPYVLIYACPKGGWSWLLLEGVRPTEEYTRYEYTSGNTREEYRVKVKKGWDCFTGRVQRPERIGELLGSPEVYLWNASGSVPVIIDTTSATGTSYKQNGKKPVEFTFHIDLAYGRERK